MAAETGLNFYGLKAKCRPTRHISCRSVPANGFGLSCLFSTLLIRREQGTKNSINNIRRRVQFFFFLSLALFSAAVLSAYLSSLFSLKPFRLFIMGYLLWCGLRSALDGFLSKSVFAINSDLKEALGTAAV